MISKIMLKMYSSAPNCANAAVSRCVSYRQADKNYKIMNYNCNIYEPANEASILKEAKEVSNRKWLLLQFKMMNNELLMNVAVSADY